MFPSHAPEQQVLAQELLRSLDAYESELQVLASGRWDADLFARIGDRFDSMRHLVSALPGLQVTWVEMLISRFELSEALWEYREAQRKNGRVLGLLARHQTVIAEMRRRCRPLVASPR